MRKTIMKKMNHEKPLSWPSRLPPSKQPGTRNRGLLIKGILTIAFLEQDLIKPLFLVGVIIFPT